MSVLLSPVSLWGFVFFPSWDRLPFDHRMLRNSITDVFQRTAWWFFTVLLNRIRFCVVNEVPRLALRFDRFVSCAHLLCFWGLELWQKGNGKKTKWSDRFLWHSRFYLLPAGDCWMMDPTPLQKSSNVSVPSPSGSRERRASAKSCQL